MLLRVLSGVLKDFTTAKSLVRMKDFIGIESLLMSELVVKSNRIIEASYKLTIGEQRLILLCIRQIKKDQEIVGGGKKLKKKKGMKTEFSIHAHDYADMFSISPNRAYTELQNVVDRLYDRSVIIHKPYSDKPSVSTLKTRWISDIEYLPTEGVVTLSFAKKMVPYISKLEGGWTRYNLENVADMVSIYGIRFYEFFRCWLFGSSSNTKKISIADLKDKLELTGKYPAIKDFKLKVIEKALTDINECSDIGAKYTTIKTGRKVTHLEFKFWVKVKEKTAAQPSAKKKTYTKADLDKNNALALPGESLDAALKRLNRN